MDKFSWILGFSSGPTPHAPVRVNWLTSSKFGFQYEASFQSSISAMTNKWIQLVYTKNGSTVSNFFNGTSNDSVEYSQFASPTLNQFGILHSNNGESEEPFNGKIDEVRLSTKPRSNNWIHSEYINQSNPSSFYSINKDDSVCHQNSLLKKIKSKIIKFKIEK